MEITQRYKIILINVLILLCISIGGALTFFISNDETFTFPTFLIYFLQVGSSIFLFLAPPVYFKVYWLIPKYLVPKKYPQYITSLLVVIIVWGFVIGTLEPWIDEHWFDEIDDKETTPLVGIFAMVFIMLVTTLLNLSYSWFVQLSRIKQIENDRLQLELSLLRNQINPHFFFNTLNNLYALSLEKSDQTSEVILKLSEIMRYTIYDCKEATVPITSEVTYLENFIALQKMRHHQRGQIRFKKDIANPRLQIAPMILIVFLENAFKHGFDLLEKDAFLNVQLTVKENFLHFFIENNFNESDAKNVSGIGLENVKRRLSLIYPNTHELAISKEDTLFRIDLKLHIG
jgi:hypothetical protein